MFEKELAKRVSKKKSRHLLLEPKKAREGLVFLHTLSRLRKTDESSGTEQLGDDFNVNKNIVARMDPFNCDFYNDLPRDAKSFVSRCASIKRYNSRVSMSQIANEQYRLLVHQSDKLYKDVMDLFRGAAEANTWRRRLAEAAAEWNEMAEINPLHAYHPDDIPRECFHLPA